MKKYLLLAATAMLFSTNAMATTYPELDGQTATVNVSADIIPICQFTSDGAIDFGTIYTTGDAGDELEISYDPSEPVVQVVTGNGIPGGNESMEEVEISCPDNFTGSDANIEAECINGGDITTGCHIGDTGYKIIPAFLTGYIYNGAVPVGGNLIGTIPEETVEINDVAGFRLILSYE